MQLLTLFILKDIEKMYQGQDVGCLSNEVIYLLPCCGKFNGKNLLHEAIGGDNAKFCVLRPTFIICHYLPLEGVTAWMDILAEADAVEKIAAAKNKGVRMLEAREVGPFVPKKNGGSKNGASMDSQR